MREDFFKVLEERNIELSEDTVVFSLFDAKYKLVADDDASN